MVDALQFAGGKFHCPVTLYAAHPEASRTLVILPAEMDASGWQWTPR